jgi:hypothetical protein
MTRRIRTAQKHTDPDPQHCLSLSSTYVAFIILLRQLCGLLRVGEEGGSRGCSLVPGAVARGIAAAESGTRQLEERLKQLIHAWDRDKAELTAKPLLAGMRQLWVDFLVRPQVLAPNLRAIQARSKQ